MLSSESSNGFFFGSACFVSPIPKLSNVGSPLFSTPCSPVCVAGLEAVAGLFAVASTGPCLAASGAAAAAGHLVRAETGIAAALCTVAAAPTRGKPQSIDPSVVVSPLVRGTDAAVDAIRILRAAEADRIAAAAALLFAGHPLRDARVSARQGDVVRCIREAGSDYDAILLARAGLVRLELPLDGLFAAPLDVDAFVPAPAQGMLGIQCRDEAPIGQYECVDANSKAVCWLDLTE